MRMRSVFQALCLLVLSAAAHAAPPLPVVQPVMACAALAGFDLSAIGGPGSRVTTAKETTANNSAVCAVVGVLAPSIGFRLQLPLRTWNQRYLQIGCGGFCGHFVSTTFAADGCAPLTSGGFATATTDMGHQTAGGAFGHDPQQRIDFAYRGVHLTALAAKRLIAQFYRQAPAFSYFSGCSDGGREALMQAQRYPDEFDGILAGAPSLIFVVQNGLYHPWQARANLDDSGKPILLASKLPLLHQAVLKQCDGLDDQIDGLLSDPRACQVDLSVLQCTPGADAATCLSNAEIGAVRRLYDGPRDSATGERLTIGGPQPGSELAWGLFVPGNAEHPTNSQLVAQEALSAVVFEPNPAEGFRVADLPFDRATLDRLRVTHPLYDASNPDLSAFANAGHKLLLWHGWSDQHITPLNSIAYHEALHRQLGSVQTEAFERLYLLPGMYHCAGGEGPSQLDLLTPLMQWVEQGQAPAGIVTQVPGTGASRQVFPYPAVATYDGKGDPKQASSYRAGPALVTPPPVRWLGEDWLKPFAPR
ncbi:feruloyl esterase [Pseudomonas turukhanskensis]|uniref:Feruloyl esterase n=2 Tax=Pseudomonas turukhanskensis TaxID=1806536 RepID=A0A9W6K3I4_9PSED|nr:feruloyl esterase [Pseudomonas turukhanskensis]